MESVQYVYADGYGENGIGRVHIVSERPREPDRPLLPMSITAYFEPPRDIADRPKKRQIMQIDSAHENVDQHLVTIVKSCQAIEQQMKVFCNEATIPPAWCTVCFEDKAFAQVNPCGHVFHPSCFLKWYRSQRTCPVCRGAVESISLAAQAEINKQEFDLNAWDDLDIPKAISESSPGEFLLDDIFSDMEMDWDIDTQPSDAKIATEDVSRAAVVPVEKLSSLAPSYKPIMTTLPNYWSVLQHGDMLKPASQAEHPPISKQARIAPRYGKLNIIEATRPHPCRCSGKCRNGRCSCVREGSVCGVSCRCTDCRNPLLPIAQMGVNILGLENDVCLMQNLSKIPMMTKRITSDLRTPCCREILKVHQCIRGFTCKKCSIAYSYSWCTRSLHESHHHCSMCKRCVSTNDIHCKDCNKCAPPNRCPCKRPIAIDRRPKTTSEKNEKDCKIM